MPCWSIIRTITETESKSRTNYGNYVQSAAPRRNAARGCAARDGFDCTEAAKQIGVTRVALSRVLNGHSGISIEMALKIEAWLGVEHGGRAEMWVGMQMKHDMWYARHRPQVA